MKKLQHVEQKIDRQSGEVTTVSKSYSIKVDKGEDFFITFVDHMAGIFRLKSVLDIKLLAKLCSIAEFNTGKVMLPSATRKELEAELGIYPSNFSNSMGRLRKLGLVSGGKGMYELNPKVFWRGTTDERNKVLKEKGLEISIKFSVEEDDSSSTDM